MRTGTIVLISLQVSCALAGIVKNLVVFGDSNSDVGNTQQWSDGPLWSEYLALGWNASLHSFAYSGSVCDSTMYKSIAKEDRVPSLKDQMEYYYNLKMKFEPEETVYAFWFGQGDIYEMSKRHGKQEPEYKEIADCISQQLKLAKKAFLSDRFLVLNVPPLQYMPYYQDSGVEANRSQATIEINRGLEKDVANLNKHHHALEMDYVDVHSLINDIVVDPTIFKFKNPLASYLEDCIDKSCKTQDYIWWDKTHFTTAFHKLVAKSIIEAESYMPKVKITGTIQKQLKDIATRFQSPKYSVPATHTNVLEDVAKLYDIERESHVQPLQPPLEDEQDTETTYTKNSTKTYLGFFFVLTAAGCFVIYKKYPNLFRSKRNTKFTLVRNEEV